MKCPTCGNDAQDDAVFCDQCGARLETVTVEAAQPEAASPPSEPSAEAQAPAKATGPEVALTCKACGASITPGEIFCGECGAPLEAPQPEPEAVDATVAEAAEAAPASVSPAERTCQACGAALAGDDTFCDACGAEVAGPGLATTGAAEAGIETPKPSPEASAPAPAVAAVAAAATPAPAAAAAPVPAAASECATCGAQINPGDAFCEFCGAALVGSEAAASASTAAERVAAASTPVQAPAPAAAQVAPPATAARLVVVASGIELPLPPGAEALVGREDPFTNVFPDIDLTPHGAEESGVSRRHFRIALSTPSQYTIEDLNSTNFTLLDRQRLRPGVATPLKDGSEIRAGRLRLIFKAGP